MIDKNKLKELIQKTHNKDLLYLTVNPIDHKSLKSALTEIKSFIGKNCCQIVISK